MTREQEETSQEEQEEKTIVQSSESAYDPSNMYGNVENDRFYNDSIDDDHSHPLIQPAQEWSSECQWLVRQGIVTTAVELNQWKEYDVTGFPVFMTFLEQSSKTHESI